MPPKPIPKSDDPPTPKADEDKKKEKKKDEEDKENVQVCIRLFSGDVMKSWRSHIRNLFVNIVNL